MPSFDPASFLSPAAEQPPAPATAPAASPPPAQNPPAEAPVSRGKSETTLSPAQVRPGFLALWSGIVLTVIYLYFELRYNRGLLDLMTQGAVSPVVLSNFTLEGKVLAAVGLSWALLRPLVMRFRGFFGKLIVFALGAAALYWGLNTGYNKLMTDLSPDAKLAGVELAAYREMLLTGKERHPGIAVPSAGKPEQVLTMTAFPLLITDARVRQAAQAALEKQVSEQARTYGAMATKAWPQYQARNKALTHAYTQYLAESRAAAQATSKQTARLVFGKNSGGMLPNPNASFEDFLVQLRASTMPGAVQLVAMEDAVLFIRREGTDNQQVIRNRDIPLGMNQAAYQQHFTKLVASIKAESLPAKATIDAYPWVQQADSALYIPMLAMLVSLVAILANVGLILWLALMNLTGQTGPIRKLGILFVAGFFAAVLLAVPRSAFSPQSPMGRSEALMQQGLGWKGQVISRLMSVQKVLYAQTAMFARPAAR